jgi:hypothetical protein
LLPDATGRIWDRSTGLQQMILPEAVRQGDADTGLSWLPDGLEKPVDVMAMADLLVLTGLGLSARIAGGSDRMERLSGSVATHLGIPG